MVLDERGRVMLTRRRDTGLWCLPGGIMEPGETVAEAVIREVLEETGVRVAPVHLVGVYSDPDLIAAYGDDVRQQPVVLCFRCEIRAGTPRISDETTNIGYFSLDQLPAIEEAHRQRLLDAHAWSPAAFIR